MPLAIVRLCCFVSRRACIGGVSAADGDLGSVPQERSLEPCSAVPSQSKFLNFLVARDGIAQHYTPLRLPVLGLKLNLRVDLAA